MAFLGGADEVVGGEIHRAEKIAKALRHLIGKGLWIDAFILGGFFHFLTVFIGSGEELDVKAVQALEPRQHIAGQRGIGVPDVGHVVDVIDRRGDVIALRPGH